MAVQQNKKSRSRKGMRRSHDRVAVPSVIFCSCGEPTLPHRVCPSCNTYNGNKMPESYEGLKTVLGVATEAAK
ncbi:MAG: 50S ribosomal protein L32 [Desulfovibrionaceae bacterium]|nr:50S ribosomal protein L32 [Desulfovibrionaceae bacterium]